MAAGIPVTKSQFDDLVGTTPRAGKIFFERVLIAKDFLDQYSSADLVTNGWCASSTDADNVKSTFADLAQLETIWRGAATLGSAKDFRTFARRLWGLGVIGTST